MFHFSPPTTFLEQKSCHQIPRLPIVSNVDQQFFSVLQQQQQKLEQQQHQPQQCILTS